MQFTLCAWLVAISMSVLSCSAAGAFPDIHLDAEMEQKLARAAAEALLANFQSRLLSSQAINEHEVRATVIPPLPDPINLEDYFLPLHEDSEFAELVYGNLSFLDSNITGLSTVTDSFEFQLSIPAGVSYSMSMDKVALEGYNELDLLISNAKIRLNGGGDYVLSIDKGFLDIDVKILILITGKFRVTDFTLDLGFDELKIDLGETWINEDLIEWDIINKNINVILLTYRPYLLEIFNPLIKDAINELTKDCSIYKLVAGDFSCLIPSTPAPGTTEVPPVTGTGPTDAPGTGPTDAPGTGPTDAPGTGPTDAPGTGPTEAPGTGPTDAPGTGPTNAPGTGPTPTLPETTETPTEAPVTSGSDIGHQGFPQLLFILPMMLRVILE